MIYKYKIKIVHVFLIFNLNSLRRFFSIESRFSVIIFRCLSYPPTTDYYHQRIHLRARTTKIKKPSWTLTTYRLGQGIAIDLVFGRTINLICTYLFSLKCTYLAQTGTSIQLILIIALEILVVPLKISIPSRGSRKRLDRSFVLEC